MAVWAALCVVLLAAASLMPSVVTAKLTAAVTPSNSSANGADWCEALKPCNETKTNSAEIESSYGLGLLFKKSTASSSYQYASTTPATAVDWRTVLTNWAVRDQGSCGSCYAFAASGSLEALIAITRESNVTSELSEAQLVECLPTADYGCDSNGDCDGCQGGDPSEALAYALSEWDGLASAALYPYGDLIDSDTAGSCINMSAEAGTGFVSVQRVPTTTLALKQAITNQPVVVGADASDWSTYYNEQGIYDGSCTTSTLNHALLVVGYSEMSTGQEYWILRNQWSSSWGAEGYIYLPISSNDDTTGGACGLLGVNNGFPPVYPSMSNTTTSGAMRSQLPSMLLVILLFAVVLLFP